MDPEKAKAWCDKTRILLNAKKMDDEAIKKKIVGLEKILEGGCPEGADEKEWEEISEEYIKVANLYSSKNKPKTKSKTLPPPVAVTHKQDILDFIAKVESFVTPAELSDEEVKKILADVEEIIKESDDPDGEIWNDIWDTIGDLTPKAESSELEKEDQKTAAGLIALANDIIDQIEGYPEEKKEELRLKKEAEERKAKEEEERKKREEEIERQKQEDKTYFEKEYERVKGLFKGTKNLGFGISNAAAEQLLNSMNQESKGENWGTACSQLEDLEKESLRVVEIEGRVKLVDARILGLGDEKQKNVKYQIRQSFLVAVNMLNVVPRNDDECDGALTDLEERLVRAEGNTVAAAPLVPSVVNGNTLTGPCEIKFSVEQMRNFRGERGAEHQIPADILGVACKNALRRKADESGGAYYYPIGTHDSQAFLCIVLRYGNTLITSYKTNRSQVMSKMGYGKSQGVFDEICKKRKCVPSW